MRLEIPAPHTLLKQEGVQLAEASCRQNSKSMKWSFRISDWTPVRLSRCFSPRAFLILMRFDRHLAQASFSFCHTVSNAVMPIGTACPKFHALLCFHPLQCLLSWTTCWLGCALTCYYVSFYKTHLLKQFLIEAMDIQQPEPQESQELPEASPPHPPQATSTTSPAATETLTPEELELIRQHRATTRESSPAKKPRTDQGWEEFLTALSAKDVELSDLDFGLQQELRSSPQARADFLALKLTSPEALHFGPDKANSS